MPVNVRLTRNDIGKFIDMFPMRMARLCAELGNIGREIASAAFESAMYDGVNDITVALEATENGCRVIANGKSVCFVEFGTGVYYGGNYLGRRPSEVLEIGQYGRGHGIQNTWAYYGDQGTNGKIAQNGKVVLTHGNPPSNAMAMAVIQMKDRLIGTAREVFNS